MRLRWEGAPASWQSTLDRIPAATFFHTPAWAETYARSGRGAYEVLSVSWADGREALVPVGVRPIWKSLLRAAVVGIDGGYGGVLATGRLDPDEMAAVMRALHRRHPEWAVTTNPFDPPAGDSFPVPLQPAGVTLTLPVAPLPEMRRHYDKERQRAVRRYLDAGVRIERAHRPDAQSWRGFMHLYRVATDDWRDLGRPSTWVRDERWLQALWHCARERLTLVTAWVDGDLVGAEVLAVQGQVATELLSVWDRRFAKWQISTALTEGSFAESLDRGCRHVDGMPSGDLDGVERFKASFGAVARPIWLARHEHWLSRALTWGSRARQWGRRSPWATSPLAGAMISGLAPAVLG